jgi:hypothetical protein
VNGQVNDLESRLRDAYRAAGDTIPPESACDLPERLARFGPAHRGGGRRPRAISGRVMVPIAAAAAIVVAAVLVPAFESGLLAGHGSQAPLSGGGKGTASAPAVTKHAPATQGPPAEKKSPPRTVSGGAPEFFISTDGGAEATLYVYSTATARVVAQIAPPASGEPFEAVAGTSDPLSYVVAMGTDFGCGSHLYELRLTADGQLSGYKPLAVPTLPEDVLALAVTPDAQSLAYVGEYCGGQGADGGDIGYVNLATRAISRWTAPKQEDLGSLSLSANGGEIGYAVQPTKLFQPEAGVLATDLPNGSLAASTQVIVSDSELEPAGTVPDWAVLGPDGRTMYVCGAGVSLGNTPPPATDDPLLTFSGTTLTHTSHLASSGTCQLSLDPSGRYLLAQTSGGFNTTSTPTVQLIDLATGKATRLPVPAANLGQGQQLFW